MSNALKVPLWAHKWKVGGKKLHVFFATARNGIEHVFERGPPRRRRFVMIYVLHDGLGGPLMNGRGPESSGSGLCLVGTVVAGLGRKFPFGFTRGMFEVRKVARQRLSIVKDR